MSNMKNILKDGTLTVAQLAISNAGALAVFNKHNIDYCCGGHKSLEDACMNRGLDPQKIKQEIDALAEQNPSQTLHPATWTSSFLIDYILQIHHRYVKSAIPEIEQLLNKVCKVHGEDCPELLNIIDAFLNLADELTEHIKKEESVLFPAIKNFESGEVKEEFTMQYPVAVMEHEHIVAGDLIKQIRSLSDNYTPPGFACPTFKITYKKLQEFDHDLMMHIHLENNILFKRIKELEAGS